MERKLKEKLPGGKFKNVSHTRSKTMSKIRGKGNKTTEVKLRYALVRSGVKGWKLHPNDIFGKPDFYFPKQKLAIFVDGCYWHGCPRCGHIPKTRTEYWAEKIKRNKVRDREVNKKLKEMDIKVIRFWEHQIKNDISECIKNLKTFVAYDNGQRGYK